MKSTVAPTKRVLNRVENGAGVPASSGQTDTLTLSCADVATICDVHFPAKEHVTPTPHLAVQETPARAVRSKSEAYALYEAGAFGNKPLTWNSVEAFHASSYSGTVSIRYSGPQGGGWCAYNVKREDVDTIVAQWASEGADRQYVRINESAPDELLIGQGEARISEYGIDLTWSTEKAKMRVAMQKPDTYRGFRAAAVLRAALTPASYEDLMELLETFPNSVVEISAYQIMVGNCRGRNAFVWEVRNY